jgi:hypothetical protein
MGIKKPDSFSVKTSRHRKEHPSDYNNTMYELYLSSRLNKVSVQAYLTIKKNTRWFITWLNRKNILLEEVTS